MGDVVEVAGVTFTVRPGVKSPDDLVLWWLTPSGWRKVPMVAVAMMTDFFVENEAALKDHRPHWRQEAADFFVGYLRHAIARGWVDADAQMQRDKA